MKREKFKISTLFFLFLILVYLCSNFSFHSKGLNSTRRLKILNAEIKNIEGGLAYDSRGKKTVFAQIVFSDGSKGIEATPAGASTGSQEANTVEVETAIENINMIAQKMKEKGFRAGEQNEFDNWLRELDGRPNLSNLGGNTTTALSMAFASASAKSKGKYLWQYLNELARGKTKPGLPLTFKNFGNGGKHSISNLEVQEVMLVVLNAKSAREELKMSDKIFAELRKLLQEDPAVRLDPEKPYGDEAGYAPIFDEKVLKEQGMDKLQKATSLMIQAIRRAGYRPGIDAGVAYDVAANTLWENAGEKIAKEFLEKWENTPQDRSEFITALKREWNLTTEEVREFQSLAEEKEKINYLVERYYRREDAGYLYEGEIRSTRWMLDYYYNRIVNNPKFMTPDGRQVIVSIEDPLSEWDWGYYDDKGSPFRRRGWEMITKLLGDTTWIVIDDLSVTNLSLFQEAIKRGVGNTILIKVNQNGTLAGEVGTLAVIEQAVDNEYKWIVSHRSGEVVKIGDQPWVSTFIADLAYGTGALGLKTGGLAPGFPERRNKYERLIEIQEKEDVQSNNN